MKRILSTLIFCCFIQLQLLSQAISPLISGQGYHIASWNDPTSPILFSTSEWTDIRNSQVKLMRAGGKQYNTGGDKPPAGFEVYYVSIIDNIRKEGGCEPVLTIPFDCPPNLNSTDALFISKLDLAVAKAKKIIHLVNVVHKRNLKYVIIANEAGIEYEYQSLPYDGVQYAKNVAAYTKPLAQAVKEVDPSIVVIGPECEYYNTKVYNILFSTNFTDPDCIAGLIPQGSGLASGLPYIDFASYHYYLYNFTDIDPITDVLSYHGPDEAPVVEPTTSTWDRDLVYTEIEKYAMGWNESASAADAPKRFRGAMRHLRQKCIAINALRTSPIGWMLTETNSSGNNEYGVPTELADGSGMDTRSMLGAQNVARMYALAMEYGATSVMFWSVREGCITGHAQDRGYLKCTTGDKRQSWFHYEAMANFFKGEYLVDKVLANNIYGIGNDLYAEPNPTWLHYQPPAVEATYRSYINSTLETKAFAAKGQNIVVMVLNHSTSNQEFSIKLDGDPTIFTTGSPITKKFCFDAGITGFYAEQYFNNPSVNTQFGMIEAESTLLLIFDCTTGALIQKLKYQKSDEAIVANKPFTSIYGTAPVPITASAPVSFPDNCIGSTSTITISGVTGSATFKWYKLPSTIAMFGYTSNAASGLTPGAYRTEIIGTCGTVNLVNVVHHESQLVDAGPDYTYCEEFTKATLIGNPELPDSYEWTSSVTACGTPAFTNNPLVTCNTSTHYIMTSTGACPMTDDCYVYNTLIPKDVYIRDSPVDIGKQPNWETYWEPGDVFWASPDIWNRVYGDGQLDHENPDYQPSCDNTVFPLTADGPLNTIYVRLKNKGCDPVTGDLDVYWSKAGTAMEWPLDWNGLDCSSYATGCTPKCSDHLFATASTVATKPSILIPPNSEVIIAVPWCPQDPNLFVTVAACSTSFPALDKGHICVMAKFHSSADDGTLVDPSGLWVNTFQRNNVAWKNMEIIKFNTSNLAGDGPTGGIIVRNIEQTNFIKLQLASRADKDGKTILDFAKVRVHVSKGLMKRWKAGGMQGKGIIAINDSVFQITNKDAFLDKIFLRYREEEGVAIEVIPFKTMTNNGEKYFTLDVIQSDANGANPNPMGGERYLIEKNYGTVPNCFTATQTLSGVIIGSPTVTGDVIITSDILVTSGKTLTFDKATVLIAENTKITVLPGGTLVINSSVLQSLCIGKKWAGIKVKGNPIFLSPLIITNSFITESSSPINVENAKGVLISNSTFLGDNTGIAITLDRMKDFEISGNTFSNYATGIKTTKTDAAIVKSSILRNVFLDVRVALDFSQDNHTKLDIRCNKFSYTDYAILSDQTLLKDQGVLGEGAGNEFISNSTLANNKLKHTSGNSPKYYYDPSNPITSGMNITTIASTTNPGCYTYAFDTSSTVALHSMVPLNPVQESIDKKVMDVYSVPNPNNGQASIYFSLGEATQGELIIMDIYGKLVDRINLNSEVNKVEVNYSEFANGIYMMSVRNSNGEVINKKMIISK